MKLNKKGIELMHKFEGLVLKAYLCPAKVWTIGYGNTFYEDGTKVKQGDLITEQRANELFTNIVNERFANKVKSLLNIELNENQFSALVSLSYNIGIANFSKSTLLKRVNANPIDKDIKYQFSRWNKAGGKVMRGLTNRRNAETKLYFDEVL